jgi:nicotinate-nucleotide adenylyltransferase
MAGSRRRIGVMGGTFDPIHTGHLLAASEVSFRLGLDHVVFVPTGQPWQKQDRQVSTAEDRYIMTVLATDRSDFDVSRVDVDRAGPTFTADTLRELHDLYDPADLYFITGADTLAGLPTWERADVVLDLARMVAVTRPGHVLAEARLPATDVTIVEIPSLEISSTMCRERVQRGEPIDFLVPAAVAEYIHKRRLYR